MMKGLRYELIIFIGVAVFLTLVWIIMNEQYHTASEILQDTISDEDTKKALGMLDKAMYFSLFFLILIGFIWVMQRATPHRVAYG